jgi:hypothetical protein
MLWETRTGSIAKSGLEAYAPELNKRCRPHLKPTNKSYRTDETYIKVKGKDKFLYRAVDFTGQTIDFLLTAKRDAAAAKRFSGKALSAPGNPVPYAATWLDWEPADEIISETPKLKLTKPPKPGSVSFGGTASGQSQNISRPEPEPEAAGSLKGRAFAGR